MDGCISTEWIHGERQKETEEERESEAQEALSKYLWKIWCPFMVLVLRLQPLHSGMVGSIISKNFT